MSPSRTAWIWRGLALALGAFAYRALLVGALQVPTAHQVESWMFRPTQLPPPLALCVAGWLLWRRRARLGALPPHRSSTATAALAGVGAALFGWAILTRSTDLLLLSLAANLLAFGSASGAGARILLVPALVLLLGLPIPAPLRNETVWHLQLATASSAARVLTVIGREFVREGVMLRSPDHVFQVIDGCSGLQGMVTLTIVAVIVGELLTISGARQWLLIASALALGYALNVVRIAYIAASSNPEAYAGLQGDHTPQGVALLAAGTALLYGLGRVAAGHGVPAREPHTPRDSDGPVWRLAAAMLAALAVASAAIPPFPARIVPFAPIDVRFPESGAGWTSEPLIQDPYFHGVSPQGQLLYRRYQLAGTGPLNEVELLIGLDAEEAPDTSHLLSSKLRWPGPEWNVQREHDTRIWELDRDAAFTIAARATGTARAVVYTWRLRDEGIWRESWRSLLALEASPLRRERKRAVVQLVAVTPFNEPLTVDRAKRRLGRFITAFRVDLEAL